MRRFRSDADIFAAPRRKIPTVGIYCIGIEFFYELRGQKTVRAVFDSEDKANWYRDYMIGALIRAGIEYIEGPLPKELAAESDKLPVSEIASIIH